MQAALLFGGLLLVQAVLYGHSLLGQSVLLPLDCLFRPGTYLPASGEFAGVRNENWLLSDAVLQTELDRVFTAREVRAGRIPFWNPYNYCGVPFLANNNAAVFSPFMIPSYLHPGPLAIAWTVLLRALVAGAGAYLFFRLAVRVSWWPALVGAWCFPLIGQVVMLSWIHHASVISLLPWMFLAVHAAVRNPRGLGGPGLAFATLLVLLSGKLDTSAQVLLASGLYALWCLYEEHLAHGFVARRLGVALAVLAAGWGLGLAAAAPVLLPTKEYLATSSRVAEQSGAKEFDFPGQGIAGLPQVVLPSVYGTELGTYIGGNGNIIESAASAYTGFLAALVLVPFAWTARARGRRSAHVFWIVAFLLAMAPILNIPLLQSIYHLFPFNLLHANRFAFVAAFAVLATAVLGLDVLERKELRAPWWFGLVAALLLAAAGWWIYRMAVPPALARQHFDAATIATFRPVYLRGVVLAVFALGLLALARFRPALLTAPARRRTLGAILVAEMTLTAAGFIPQSPPSQYYPPHPTLSAIAGSAPGRICGAGVLPANLNRTHGLSDVRGYDGLDPLPLVRLLEIANPEWGKSIDYAITQDFVPIASPVLDLLGLRYRIIGGTPPAGQPHLVAAAAGFWVHESSTALPRPFVPRTHKNVSDSETAFAGLADPAFDPAEIAFVELQHEADLPPMPAEGRAIIAEEVPGRLRIEFEMTTPGVLVLQDLWYPGWRAHVDYGGDNESGEIEILRANGALQAVYLQAGSGTLELRYRPSSFTGGIVLGGMSLVILGFWTVRQRWLLQHGGSSR